MEGGGWGGGREAYCTQLAGGSLTFAFLLIQITLDDFAPAFSALVVFHLQNHMFRQASPKRRPKQCSRKLVPETHNTEHAGICTSMQTASHGFLMLRTRFVEDPRQFWIQLTGDWTLEQRPQRKACSCSPGMQCRSLSCLRARQLGAHPCSTCQSAGSVHTNGPLLQPSSSTKPISHVSQLPHDKCNTTTYLLG